MGFASIDGVTLHYRVSGEPDGRPLVLVNSLGTSLAIWDELIGLLGPRHRVLTYDKRGHGLSDTPAAPYGLDDQVRDLLGLTDHCGFQRFDICGVSLGGMIAMRLAARHPERVDRLVLCDTAPVIGTAASWNERIAAVRAGGMAAIAGAVLDRWVAPQFRRDRPADHAGWRNMLERCPADGYAASCATVRDADLWPDLPRVVAPTLVLAGEHDLPTPPDLVRQLAGAIPNASFELIAGAGHVPSIEQPARLCQLITAHLSEAANA